MRLINRHLLTATAGPFVFGWVVITFLLMIDVLFRYVDLFVSKGVPFLLATRVLGLSLGHTFALSVPMAVLVGVLMGVGQLAADHEITAMRASGLSLWTIARPLFLAAAVVTATQAAYNHYVYPRSNHLLVNLLQDISRQKPMLEIREHQFTDLNDKLTIFVRHKDDRTGAIGEVSIFEKAQPGDPSPRLTIAARGHIIPDHERDQLRIELEDGEIHEMPDPQKPGTYQLTRFKRHNLVVDHMEQDFQASDRTARGDREMDLTALRAAMLEERGHKVEVRGRVREQAGTILDEQWKVLDPAGRATLANAAGGDSPRADVLDGRFRATRQKVQRALDQDRYQIRLYESYQMKENKYDVEYHKKFAIPVACLVFVLLGVPMAVAGSRSGRGISVSLALAVYLVYYAFLMGGEKLADRGRLDPVVAMWAANVVLTGIGIPLFAHTVREGRLPDLPTLPWRRRSGDDRGAAR